MYTKLLTFLIVMVVSSGLGFAGDLSGKLTIQGSGREQAIFEKAAVKFEKQNPRVRTRIVEPEGLDPLAAVKEGSVDITVLGRTLAPEERRILPRQSLDGRGLR